MNKNIAAGNVGLNLKNLLLKEEVKVQERK
jgi:hypothetical protein